jgi:DNA-binding HxlR family transcriptional regulator
LKNKWGEKNLSSKPKKDILSKEFKVACEIYRFNEKEEKVWFTKLKDSLEGEMVQSTLMNALRTLFDWGIVKAEYGETEKGRAGRLLFVAGESRQIIKDVYETYWKPAHQ